MTGSVFLAGASGAIGRRLIPMLVADGRTVFGMTRTREKLPALRALGAEPVLADAFDAPSVRAAVMAAKPAVVVHQLSDLPPGLDPARMAECLPRNARLREEGTRILVDAAVRAGVGRLVAQSIAFAYAGRALPHREQDALAVAADGLAGVTARGVAALEHRVLSAPLLGIVLRYGLLYGPGTGFDAPAGPGSVHVDAAARAALLALSRGGAGLYNVAEDDGTVCVARAARELGWTAG